MRKRKIAGAPILGGALALMLGLALSPEAVFAQGEATAKQPAGAPTEQPRQIQVTILGMSCPFCAYGAQQKLKRLEGVKELKVVLKTGLATLTMEDGSDLSNELLRKTVKEAGFEAAKITRNFDSEYPEYGSQKGS
ncbi:MAG: heavy-metal-associated domain-containing protein [Gemmatimonadota bacterium]